MIYTRADGRMVFMIDTAPLSYEYFIAWPYMHRHAQRYSTLVHRTMEPIREDTRGYGTGMIIGWIV